METATPSSIQAMRDAAASQQFTPPFAPLERVTKPTLTTAEYAYYMGMAEQTARIHACRGTGPLRPIRVPGSSLLRWPTAATKALVGMAA